jgi:hypothetical protein
MFMAYLDGSNSNLQGKVCTVAGFLGTESQWEYFLEDWAKTLGRKKSLHMKDLRWWRDSDRDLLAGLGALPDKHRLKRVASLVRNEDYAEIVKGKIRDRCANPYMLAVQMCVAQILNYVSPDASVAVYLEQQSVYKWRVTELSERVLRMNTGRLLSVSTLKKGQCSGFQVADYLSYAVSQLREKPHGFRTRWCKSVLGNGACIDLSGDVTWFPGAKIAS